jgi:hypothetical protein
MSSIEKSGLKFDYKPLTTVFSKNDSLLEYKDLSNYKSFLCDMELFNWLEEEYYDFSEHKLNVAYNTIYHVFTSFLARTLANDLTLFTMDTINQSTKLKYNQWLDHYFSTTYNDYEDRMDKPAKNRIFNFPAIFKINTPINLKKALSDAGMPDDAFYLPIVIKEHAVIAYSNKFYSLYYCDSIVKSKKTRYSLMSCLIIYADYGGHYTFLFVDHEKKEVEFYDPNIIINKGHGILFIYKALGEIFKNYKINEFWNLTSIQKTEEYEKDKKGFCVIWGHMMLNLKLLNINIPITELEKLFIKECENKNISLYELVLNYTYYMRRIIPTQDMDKFVNMRDLLWINL